MGPLALPERGPIYLDANALIYSLEMVAPYFSVLAPLWDEAQRRRLPLVSSQIVLMEVLVKPVRTGDSVLENRYRAAFAGGAVRLEPVSPMIVETGVRIRAATGIKTPDALHAATALSMGCALFITNDASFRRVEGLPVTVLNDFLEAAP